MRILLFFLAILLGGEALQPVVLLNGLAGSNLKARLRSAKEPHSFCDSTKDWFRIWMSVEELVNHPNCYEWTRLYIRKSEEMECQTRSLRKQAPTCTIPGAFLRPSLGPSWGLLGLRGAFSGPSWGPPGVFLGPSLEPPRTFLGPSCMKNLTPLNHEPRKPWTWNPKTLRL